MKIKLFQLFITLIITILLTQFAYSATYQYDNLNRLSKITYDDGRQIVYTYDASGNRSAKLVTVQADTNLDFIVNLEDFAQVALHWMESECLYPDLCNEADLNWSGEVGLDDIHIVANQWLEQSLQLLTTYSIGNGSIEPESSYYLMGQTVPLTATPDTGYQVKQWTGTDNDASRDVLNSVKISGVVPGVTVEFEPLYELTASVIGNGGTISPTSGSYTHGTVVPLTAVPGEGYIVKQWSGSDDDTSIDINNSVTMTENKIVTVEFEEGYLNMGFEYGDFSNWNTNTWGTGSVGITGGLTEGSYSAFLYADGFVDSVDPEFPMIWDGQAELNREFIVQGIDDYSISFDYNATVDGSASIYLTLNDQSYSLYCDGQMHQFSTVLTDVSDSIFLEISVEGYSPFGHADLQVDNFQIPAGEFEDYTNMGFEYGDLTYWTVSGNIFYDVSSPSLTEGDYHFMAGALFEPITLNRSLTNPCSGCLIKFDYISSGTVSFNGQTLPDTGGSIVTYEDSFYDNEIEFVIYLGATFYLDNIRFD